MWMFSIVVRRRYSTTEVLLCVVRCRSVVAGPQRFDTLHLISRYFVQNSIDRNSQYRNWSVAEASQDAPRNRQDRD